MSSLWDQEQISAEQVRGINSRKTDHMSVLLPEKFALIHFSVWGRQKQTNWAKSSHSTYSRHSSTVNFEKARREEW